MIEGCLQAVAVERRGTRDRLYRRKEPNKALSVCPGEA